MKPEKRIAAKNIKPSKSDAKARLNTRSRKSRKPSTINKVWFITQFATKRISQRQLSFQIGMDPAALSMTLSGNRKMQLPEAEAIAAQLGVPVQEVLTNAGINMSAGAAHDALVVGWIGNLGEVHEGRVEGPQRVSTPTGMAADTQVLRFQGADSTDGWLVFYQPGNGITHDCIGRLCVIKSSQGTTYVARLVRGYTSGVWNLIDQFGRGGMIEGVKVISASPVQWLKTS